MAFASSVSGEARKEKILPMGSCPVSARMLKRRYTAGFRRGRNVSA